MTYNVNLGKGKTAIWTKDELINRLSNLQNANKKVEWIRSDLSTKKSNWLTRMIWTMVAKHFKWMRKAFYKVDLEKSRNILNKQLRHQIASDNNRLLITLFNKAVKNFYNIAPNHLADNASTIDNSSNGSGAKVDSSVQFSSLEDLKLFNHGKLHFFDARRKNMSTNSINGFINQNYNVVYKSDGVDESDLSSANEFLLADNHGSSGHGELNSLFINTFATIKDVVMVEAISSMSEVAPDEALQSVWLKTKAKIVGWDTGKVGEIIGSTLFQETGDLEIKGQISLRQLLNPEFDGNKEEVKKKLMKVFRRTMELAPELMVEIGSISETAAKTFPGRIKSMIDSMGNAGEIFNRTFLIAGEKHLKNEENDSRCSLEEFYKFIKSRKVVVLFPKIEVVAKMGEKRNTKMKEIVLSAMSL